MNKKIKTILFTLFVAGLLTVSCSSKDKTGPSSDNGGGTTIPENGTGIDSGYLDRRFAPEADRKLKVTSTAGVTELSDVSAFQLDTQKPDGSILVKMPLLKTTIGFTSDLIKIPAKNIVEGNGGNYTVKTRYTLEKSENKTVTVDLETTTVKDAEPETEVYTIETAEDGIKHASSGRPAINGTGAIEPKY